MKKTNKKYLIGIGVILIIVTVAYISGLLYYNNRFMARTSINGIDVSSMSVDEAHQLLSNELTGQKLDITFIDDKVETLDQAQVGIEYNPQSTIDSEFEKQKSYKWFVYLFNHENYEIDDLLNVDEKKLVQSIQGLNHLQKDAQKKPSDATIQFVDNEFKIIDEVYGSTIDTEAFQTAVVDAFKNKIDSLNANESKLYVEPKVLKDNETLLKTLEDTKTYADASITYQTISGNVSLNQKDILTWFDKNDEGVLVYNEEFYNQKAKDFVSTLATKINIKNKAKTFKSATGKTKTVSGGNYGFTLNQNDETTALIQDIKDHKKGTRTPVVSGSQAAYTNGGLGQTFVEIDMTAQKMYLVKNGSVALSSDCVTGMATNPGRKTPGGVYYIYFMQRDRVLRGTKLPDGTWPYEVPVSYWMAFNVGIGLHDSTRSAFGGDIYINNGSHGCINLPPNVAKSLYSQIKVGTPVVCYY